MIHVGGYTHDGAKWVKETAASRVSHGEVGISLYLFPPWVWKYMEAGALTSCPHSSNPLFALVVGSRVTIIISGSNSRGGGEVQTPPKSDHLASCWLLVTVWHTCLCTSDEIFLCLLRQTFFFFCPVTNALFVFVPIYCELRWTYFNLKMRLKVVGKKKFFIP